MEDLHRAILGYLREQRTGTSPHPPAGERADRIRDVAIYARVTASAENAVRALDAQVAACRDAARRLGAAELRVFADIAPGDTLDRLRLAELRAAIAHGRIATVLVTSLDRLLRDPVLLAALLADWAAAEVRVVTVEGDR